MGLGTLIKVAKTQFSGAARRDALLTALSEDVTAFAAGAMPVPGAFRHQIVELSGYGDDRIVCDAVVSSLKIIAATNNEVEMARSLALSGALAAKNNSVLEQSLTALWQDLTFELPHEEMLKEMRQATEMAEPESAFYKRNEAELAFRMRSRPSPPEAS